jgi:predicted enzyme related to lactoylglutathione lyase
MCPAAMTTSTPSLKQRVTGIGGVFFKVADPAATKAWYQENLGIEPDEHGNVAFEWREKENPETVGQTVWSPFKKTSTYFDPSTSPFMLNFRVRDLHKMLAQLKAAGCTVDAKTEEGEYGKFGWVMDPDGTRIELWEPPPA